MSVSRIVHNSLLNGAALGVTSLLSLVLVPMLIAHYGLDAYGLVPLVRLFTPLGAFGIAALGLPQLAARSAGIHAARVETVALRRSQSTLVALCALLGIAFAALLLSIGPARFEAWLKVRPAEQHAFAIGFGAACVALPVLMAGIVVTASLTGLGRFKILRATEVGLYLAYFAVAAGAVAAALPITAVLLALLATDALRSVAVLAYARRSGAIALRDVLSPDFDWLARQARDFTVISVSSLLGYVRKFLPATSIPLLFGPAALGIYDAIERVPRALKTLLGLVSTSVLPRAIQLDAGADKSRLRSLLVRGTRLTLLCVLPLSITVMLYAEPIVSVWLGQHLAYGGVFLVLLMIPFVLDATLSIVGTATLSRVELISEQNKVTLAEIVILIAAMTALIPLYGENSPYAATATAAASGYILRLRALLPAYEIPVRLWLSLVAKITVGSLVGAGAVYLVARMSMAERGFQLLTSPCAALAGAAVVLLFWNAGERKDVRDVAQSLRALLPFRAPR